VVYGLEIVPPDARPPVTPVHLSFQVMVGIGTGFVALALWYAFLRWRRRDLAHSRWFLRAGSVAGVAAVLALEAGWVTTEVGRQPWIVFGQMRVMEAVNPEPGLLAGLIAVVVVYTVLTVATVVVLRRLARIPLDLVSVGLAPQEPAPPEPAQPSEPGPGGPPAQRSRPGREPRPTRRSR
jgi:cytochrome d ubiquinol oxidase subunit I